MLLKQCIWYCKFSNLQIGYSGQAINNVEIANN